MDKMIAYCGLSCSTCPIYLATIEKDEGRKIVIREAIVEQCVQQYGMHLQLEDITDCDGCKADTGRLFSGCFGCEIRKCAMKRNMESCAYCIDYGCEKLEQQFLFDPDAKNRLEEIRRAMN